MRPPFVHEETGPFPVVFSYGDANADFHLVGDHPGVHGGTTTGIPFTGNKSGDALQSVFRAIGFCRETRDGCVLDDLFCSYLHMCALPNGRRPTDDEYAELERFFDAELRAINAHVLLPVGERATRQVLAEYTNQLHRLEVDMRRLHARDLRGRGFLVVPIREPTEWDDGDREALYSCLRGILASDYRQTKGVATLVG